MNGIKRETRGRQKALFDEVVSTVPAGVFFDRVEAEKIFPDKIVPAGSLVYNNDDKYVVTKSESTGKVIGLTREDVLIDDYPSVSVVVSATVRKAALEESVVKVVEEHLKRITLI